MAPNEIERLRVELARAYDRIAELEARADSDPLLGVLNRRGFERELARSIAYIKRYGTEAVLIYLDLDGFKAINDRHGHSAGDALLKAVAEQLTAQIRASDLVARLGGDELAVLMWNVDPEVAAVKLYELERMVSQVTVDYRGASLSVGASAGLAALAAEDTPADVIDTADRAMYARKKAKRT